MISKNQIKFVKSLQQKKQRDIHQCFVVESTKNVLEILQSDYELLHLYATEHWLSVYNIKYECTLNVVSEKEIQRISSLKSASEVLAVVKIPIEQNNIDLKDVNIVLDDIKDPGNLGTIIRVCDWFGVKNIYCSNQSVDVYNPKVIQSTMGSISRVEVVYTDIVDLIRNSSNEVKIYAAVMDGVDVNNIKVAENSLIVFGNESHGISQEILSLIKEKITIQKIGEAESLNVAVSSAIILNKFCV
ncbi:MAG: RNA methyltransferase [Flavobacteriales bacterium]|nr:RNA methyltransferase [Flavobacteriales bacterium]|tara:strand:- start:2662 stop:3393 length:732 start_codon:yes stop_codon:yes gene_type:complete